MDDLCQLFKGVDDMLVVKPNSSEFDSDSFSTLNNFCPISDDGNDQKCNNYEEMFISAFITLVVNLKNKIENDKLAQYAILWLCYKLSQIKKNITYNINEFYNNHIKGIEKYISKLKDAENYNSCMGIINKKQYLMSMDIKIASNIYKAFEKLCKLYTECNKKNNSYLSCSQDGHDFVNEFKKLNDDPSITGNNSYIEILYILSTDYNNFKNNCAKKCSKCSDIPTLTDIKVPQSFVQDQVESSGVTSPSSPIASKLIPVLSMFGAIPIFFGIAYKYSLFGFDKRRHRQYLREKVKKIKNKMNRYI
ncbi:Plasmodium variant antigen protein Cir/Yir/Bir, putative [Plasmodium chabaudi chabaudi]|uniref:Plasmodium variant antigen protein Cir/Yir/Bir, putative n=1 Tax=Plasmodium chabaudi chabaudi TaxID=31271 RepID=A0A1C6WCE6_PLACU|nr:Plasmodium variant antigen protein Cir/Yir/Bir, putative [Plasmodium chabaudi chabaudi]